MNNTIRRGARDYKPGKPNDNYDQYYCHLIGKGMVACLSMSTGQRPHSGCFHTFVHETLISSSHVSHEAQALGA